ncbi:MAG: GNAT family N-acetyltransferase [Pseudomonadota bacterium]
MAGGRAEDATLRRLTAGDAEAFSALRRLVAADNPVPLGLGLREELTRPLQGFRDQLSASSNAVFGAFVGGTLAATAALAPSGPFTSSRHKLVLWGTFVAPAHRRKGLGRAVVRHAIDHARHNGARRVHLTMYLPNPAAGALYESLGFAVWGTEPEAVCIDGVYHDAIQMGLLLQ